MYDLVIIGAGPAGLSAAIYAKRAGLYTILLEKEYISGGQIVNTYSVDNYPGMPGVTGMELAEAFEKHADALAVRRARGEVKQIRPQDGFFWVLTEEKTYETKTVLLACGARYRKLGVPGEEKLTGMGVSYCATCDGAFFKDKVTAVVGGGNVALEDALFLARGCEKVYLIHRRDELRGVAILQEQVKAAENIEILWDSVLQSIDGEERTESLHLQNVKTKETTTLPVDGVFIAVGIVPNTEYFQDLAETDENGFLVAGEDCATSAPGLYVAGDARTSSLRQILTAAADGARAVTSIQQYLLEQNLE